MKLIHIFSKQVEIRSGPLFESQPTIPLDLANLPKECAADAYYLINVHAFAGVDDKAQNQSGLRVYRHLLQRFEGNQDKLKVIFYSPLAKEVLVSLKPENYVLKILPFIQTRYDGKLLVDLHDAVEDYKELQPQFNNASENLLSGWSLLGAKKINLHGRKPLVVEDEWKDWKDTYTCILSQPPKYFLDHVEDIKYEFRKLNSRNTREFNHLPDGALEDYDLIIQDLYLWERHDTQRWKTEDLIKSISGLRLFAKIREIEPAIPVVFHTTSTKYRIYESLNSLGADGQIPKNINPDATNDEKEETFRLLRRKLEAVTNPYLDCWLNEFFRYLEDDNGFGKSWFSRRQDVRTNAKLQTDVVFLLQNLILDYKNLWRVDTEYLERWFGKRKRMGALKPLALTVSGIMVNAAKLMGLHASLKNVPEMVLLDKLRDAAAHERFDMLQRIDVLFLLVLARNTFEDENQHIIGEKQGFPMFLVFSHGRAKRTYEKYNHPVVHYAHFYRHWSNSIPKPLQKSFKDRIAVLFSDFLNRHWKGMPVADKKAIIQLAGGVINEAAENKPVYENGSCHLGVVL